MRTRTTLARTAVVLAVLAAGLTACSGSDSDAGSGSGSGSGTTTLTYWATNMAPTLEDDKKVLTPELAKFTKDTGIAVNLEVIPWDSLYNRILTAVSSGQGPDVLNIGNTWSASLQATGAFVPFEGDAATAVGGLDRFVKTSLASTGAEGETPTSVPLYGQAYGIFYNKTLLAKAGVTPPESGWTWQQFTDAAKKLTKDTNGDGKPDQYGFAVTGAAVPNGSHAAFILGRQRGASLFTPDGTPDFANAGTVQAVTDFVSLMSGGLTLPGSAEYTGDAQAAEDLARGRVAMVFQQSGSRNAFAALKFTDYGVVQPPVIDPLPSGGKATETMVAGINVSVFDTSKQKDAALKLVNFLTSDAEQVTLNKAYTTLPVVTAAYDDPAFTDPVSKTFGDILTEHAEPMPQIPAEGQMETLVGGAVKTLIGQAASGKQVTAADVKAALSAANDQMKAAG